MLRVHLSEAGKYWKDIMGIKDERVEKKYVSEDGGYIDFRFVMCECGIWRSGTDNC